jgi:hypothetical protein
MPSWTHARRVRKAIHLAHRAGGWRAATRIIGGVDDESLPLLTSADTLITVWSRHHTVLHLLPACGCMEPSRCN